jgi:RHS repeat-associated protein
MSPSRLALVLFCLFSIPFLPSKAFAQLPQAGDTTSTPAPGGHDYLHSPAETLNPANGSVSIRIPLPVPSGRQLTMPLAIAYDSSGAFYYGSSQGNNTPHWATPPNVPFSKGGWSYTFPLVTYTQESWTETNGFKNFICKEGVNYVFQDPAGNRHNLGLTPVINPTAYTCSSSPGVLQGGEGPILATTSSGAGVVCCKPVTVTDGNGTVYSFNQPGSSIFQSVPSSVSDRNGNSISFSVSGTPISSATVTDTIGRTAISVGTFGSSPDSINIAGLSTPYKAYWTTASASFVVGVSNSGSSACPTSLSGSAGVISQVTLPNGQSYTFSYDPTYGMLSKITYPTGGYVRYVWGLNSRAEALKYNIYNTDGSIAGTYDCHYDFPAIVDRYISFNGTTEVLHQHLAYSTSWGTGDAYTTKTTTVTTYDLVRNTNFQTIYTYSGVGAPCVPDMNPNSNTGCVGDFTQQTPVEQTVQYYATSGTLLRTVTKGWFNNNVRLLGSEQVTLDNGQSSLTVNCYDLVNEQLLETDSYDLGTSAPSLPSCALNVPSGTTAGSLLRKTTKTYASFSGAHIVDLTSTVITYNGSGSRVAETDTFYDQTGGSNRGNPTTITKKCFSLPGGQACPQGDSTSTFTYDTNGQMLTMKDPKNNQTSYSYADNYSGCGGHAPPTSPSDSYLTQVTYPLTSGVNHIVSYCYDYSSGLRLSSTDENSLTTIYKYVDSMDRLTETDFPDGGKTTISYNDTPPSPTVTTSKKINSSGLTISSAAVSDGLGHIKQTQLTSDPQGTIYTDTAYDGLGRVYTVSNPYRTGNDPTTSAGTTTFVYDALGRKLTATYPDTSVLATAYCGPSTLATDPVGKWRRSRTDGLGRLVEVDEPNAIGATVASTGCPGQSDPIWVTSYTLDALGDLTQVVQNGSHTRTFTFDSLSHLLTSSNPELGAITYGYDANGNVSTKADARSITTTYVYDALNRQTSVTYSNGDPTITTIYDGSSCLGLAACQNIGHATSTTDGAGSELWAYQIDSANQRSVHVNQRTTNGITKTSTYYLDLAGNLTSITYPTGRVVNYTYDAADRPATAADSTNGITYATAQSSPPTGCLTTEVCYTPQGTDYSAAIGKTGSFSGVNFSETYNSRLQPLEIKASSTAGNAIDITYSFVDPSTLKNSGHVYSITNNLNSSRTQSFSYDQVNRILTAGTTATTGTYCWGYQYAYDGGNGAWGNLTQQAGWSPNYNGCSEGTMGSVNADGNNHISGFSYDASGNTLNDGTIGYTYDAESQIKTAAGVTYSYDGSGRRVSKSNGKLYWYGSGGEILAETNASGTTLNEYIFFGGKRVAILPAGGNAQYYVEDLLGSSRVMTTNNGTLCYDADFDPFGGEHTYTNNCPSTNAYKFEGKERDAETGNDDFGARYYTSRFGRWLSADWSSVPVPVPYANLTNPQTLNLYAMVADDPETAADLDGHCGAGYMPGAGVTEACTNTSTHALQGEGQLPFDENTGIADWYFGEVSAASAEYAAQQQASQNSKQLEDLVKMIQEAKASTSDPVTTVIKIINGLGADVTVSGATLRDALAKANVPLDSNTSALLSNADTITKKGSKVTITNKAEGKAQLGDTEVTVAAKVSFNVSVGNGLATIDHIKGLTTPHEEQTRLGKVTVNAALDLASVSQQNGHTVLHVEAHWLLKKASVDKQLN